jgi:beta-lactamase regulating signal transducer with metallopeptidase domain
LAILVVFLLRLPARRILGSGLAYRLWALPLAAGIASLFPTLGEFMRGSPDAVSSPRGALGLLAVWSLGGLAWATALLRDERRFRRLARSGQAGPAVMGLGWHVLVVPTDFTSRFTQLEREFIRRHERMHVARLDPLANLLIAVLQTLSWFNPLAHLAARYARLDQELACDEAVVSLRPETRRAYAETLLKAQLSAGRSPFACAFSAFSPARHPLEVRLQMLGRPQPGPVRHLVGGVSVAALGLLLALAVWAGGDPDRPARAHLTLELSPQAEAAPLLAGAASSG